VAAPQKKKTFRPDEKGGGTAAGASQAELGKMTEPQGKRKTCKKGRACPEAEKRERKRRIPSRPKPNGNLIVL